jgi:uncharacterized protein
VTDPTRLAQTRAGEIIASCETATPNKLPHRNLYTRLDVSSHGIGVFAIKDIPDKTMLFQGDVGEIVRVPRDLVDEISKKEIQRIYFDFCPMLKGAFIAPVDFNQMTMSWYMNHSTTPNVQANPNFEFITTRPIYAGEELTTDYAIFSEHAELFVKQWPAEEATPRE